MHFSHTAGYMKTVPSVYVPSLNEHYLSFPQYSIQATEGTVFRKHTVPDIRFISQNKGLKLL